jgi:hypothetical protein
MGAGEAGLLNGSRASRVVSRLQQAPRLQASSSAGQHTVTLRRDKNRPFASSVARLPWCAMVISLSGDESSSGRIVQLRTRIAAASKQNGTVIKQCRRVSRAGGVHKPRTLEASAERIIDLQDLHAVCGHELGHT